MGCTCTREFLEKDFDLSGTKIPRISNQTSIGDINKENSSIMHDLGVTPSLDITKDHLSRSERFEVRLPMKKLHIMKW